MQSEADALADWCALLPTLREQARSNGVLDRLDRDAERVREGGSAQRALRKWGPRDSVGNQRSWSDRTTVGLAVLPGGGRPPGAGSAEYVCPRDRCARRAHRDEHGHLPRCTAFDTPMRPA
ncbi:hypothetical protein [Micromonospora sp. NPDC048830]|uniref:hypothetical protein n=1 Tax=Micromonospora sp. NPDC048830 TaxID=3364257 RepID=UPI00371DE143